jgi:hypothetical protein
MIGKLYDAMISGEIFGKLENSMELNVAEAKLEGFINGTLDKKQTRIVNELLADYSYENGKQFFALGFKTALQLFTEAKKINA